MSRQPLSPQGWGRECDDASSKQPDGEHQKTVLEEGRLVAANGNLQRCFTGDLGTSLDHRCFVFGIHNGEGTLSILHSGSIIIIIRQSSRYILAID